MPRALRRSAALLLTGGALLAACREHRHDQAAPPTPAPSATIAPDGGGELDASFDADADAAADAGLADAAADGSASLDGCPPEMARVGRFCIDRWEAHLVTRGDDDADVPWPHYQRPAADKRYEARSASGVFPQGYMSRVESQSACKNAGKRLCTMDEWRRSCGGKKRSSYPYGFRYRAGACNSGKVHLLSQMFGANGQGWKYDEHFNSPALLQEPGFLARAGETLGCESSDGVFDQVGNLHEWVSDTVTQELFDHLQEEPVDRRSQPWREGNGVFMGGFFSTTHEHGPGCSFVTIAHEPRYHDYSIGFRCCKTPEGLPKSGGK